MWNRVAWHVFRLRRELFWKKNSLVLLVHSLDHLRLTSPPKQVSNRQMSSAEFYIITLPWSIAPQEHISGRYGTQVVLSGNDLLNRLTVIDFQTLVPGQLELTRIKPELM